MAWIKNQQGMHCQTDLKWRARFETIVGENLSAKRRLFPIVSSLKKGLTFMDNCLKIDPLYLFDSLSSIEIRGNVAQQFRN